MKKPNWNQKLLVLWKSHVLIYPWQSATRLQRSRRTWRNAALWNRKWAIKIRKKPNGLAASRRGGSEMWDSGPFTPPFLQYCSVLEEHTNQRAHPTTCFLSLRKRRSAHAQECLFILAGFVLLIIYIWNDGISTSPKIKTKQNNTATNPKTQPTTKIHPEPKQGIWQTKHFTVHGDRRHRITWAPSARSCLSPVQDHKAHRAPIPTAIQRAPEPAFHMKENSMERLKKIKIKLK